MQWKEVLTTMKPYKPGRSTEEVKKAYRLENVVKLASNENPYGCASICIRVFKQYIDAI